LNQDNGDILIDGISLNDIKIESLSRQISMVLQEPFLFSGTIKENIKYNNVQATDESMIEASKAVGAHDFISKMDKGYDTVILERGSNVSLGQRQLLSFARAILSDPRILILDEATSSIDSYTELRVQEALKTILKDRTAIVIAHRLSTVRGADRIIVLNNGTIIEDGNHEELMQSKSLYHHLYNMNFSSIEP
jgi:ABC-type bacteriocin/lantibiotic exporters, contain an N-terminal double-glycine peptidase domain